MPALTWRSAEHIPTVCKRVVETNHPINKDVFLQALQRTQVHRCKFLALPPARMILERTP